MGNSFASLKKKNKSGFTDLQKQVENTMNPSNKYKDERYWRPTKDKSNNGKATIRFLPPSPNSKEGSRWVQIFKHSFKVNNQWYIENSLTTLGQNDPVAELNSAQWDDQEAKIRKQGRLRRTVYVSNVYVVDDPANPENNGKVFLYEFGQTIFDKINEAICPTDEDEEPIDPFDFWEGANFKIIIKDKDGWANYELSKFMSPKKLLSTDEEMEEVWNRQHDLEALLDQKNFKSYDELVNRLVKVLGNEAAEFFDVEVKGNSKTVVGEDDDDDDDDVEDEVEMESLEEDEDDSMEMEDLESDDEDEAPFDLDEDDDDLESFQDLVD